MAYTSLYRRYRPRRFAEMRGQEHVVSALRNAVAADRVLHAYLLSGPRGTGKTTAARILAKALNCAATDGGEPCCECPSCTAIDEGTSFDLHELDAASNNKVDDMRDLLAKVALGTPGRTKVYLLDEVHMLTSGAENALLKTLEEPPDHVVFVLATTEPHKVVETIRSRSQHLELTLLPADQLESLARDVVADAGLDVDDAGIAHAVRAGRGSARDALSALDRVVAGGVGDDDEAVRGLLESLAAGDAGLALAALAAGIGRGREPRVVGEALLAALRESFLVAMGVPSVQLADADRERAEWFAGEVTPAVITRALEVLGTALVDMRRSPDPRVDLEVALVRLTGAPGPSGGGSDGRGPAGSAADAGLIRDLVARVERLETVFAAGTPTAGPQAPRAGVVPPVPPPPPRSASGPAAAGRARLAEVKEAPAPTPPGLSASDQASPGQPIPAPAAAGSGPAPTRDELVLAWGDDLLDRMSRKGRARFAAGRFTAVEDGTAVMALPNEPHRKRCEDLRGELEAVLAARFGTAVPVRLVVDDGSTAPSTIEPSPAVPSGTTTGSTPDVAGQDGPQVEEDVDLTDLTDADAGEGSAVDAVTRAFPGATLVNPD